MRWLVLLLIGCSPIDWGLGPTTTFWGPVNYVDRHGVFVVESGYPVNRLEQEALIENELVSWEVRLGEDYACPRAVIRGWALVWQPFPFTSEWYRGDPYYPPPQFAGLTIPSIETMLVGFREPLDSTALGHELGHSISGECTGAWGYGH